MKIRRRFKLEEWYYPVGGKKLWPIHMMDGHYIPEM